MKTLVAQQIWSVKSDAMTTHQTHNTATLPAGATEVFEWVIDGDNVTRMFRGPDRGSTELEVTLYGAQDYSGAVLHREIIVCPRGVHGTAELDAAGARQVAAGLLAAADELDGEASASREHHNSTETPAG